MPNKKTSDNNTPNILNENPAPKLQLRTFHKTKLPGWAGHVEIDKIHGWADNRRIELFRRKCEEQFARKPNDDEIYLFMISDREAFHIQDLGKSILLNGVRVPIILSSEGILLDGNRRLAATRWAIEQNPEQKDELGNLPVWVLTVDATEEHKRKVLVECNFINDWRVEWPPYIKAATVFEDYVDRKLEVEELVNRYGLTKPQVRTMIRVMNLIQEYLTFHRECDEAINIANKNYSWFEEASNKCHGKLDADADFKEQFFEWMHNGKFKNMKQVGKLSEIRDNEEAWAAIRSDNPDAVDVAIHIVQGDKLPDIMGGEKKVRKIIKQLQGLKEQEIVAIGRDTLAELQSTLKQVVKMSQAVQDSAAEGSNES